ncbi:unnamed protein product [Amoebophrya sp. A25]|nr:unnamed protein product [Amoebophrya sp. A25]|eukprot:GSA25T00003246001.1
MIAIKLSADPEHNAPAISACLIHMEVDTEAKDGEEEQILKSDASTRVAGDSGPQADGSRSCLKDKTGSRKK